MARARRNLGEDWCALSDYLRNLIIDVGTMFAIKEFLLAKLSIKNKSDFDKLYQKVLE